jgi:hypothetical protein
VQAIIDDVLGFGRGQKSLERVRVCGLQSTVIRKPSSNFLKSVLRATQDL